MKSHTLSFVAVICLAAILSPISIAAQAAAKPTAKPAAKASPTASTMTAPLASGLTEERAPKKAQDSLVAYFRDVFMKTDDFTDILWDAEWKDISAKFIESLTLERDMDYEKLHYEDIYLENKGDGGLY